MINNIIIDYLNDIDIKNQLRTELNTKYLTFIFIHE